MAENSPNLGREMDIQIKEAQQTSNKLNLKRSTLLCGILKEKQKQSRLVVAVGRWVGGKGQRWSESTNFPL